ncbi:MAG: FtsX-like permease family protein, partial [Pedobacter sp.]
VVFIVGLLIVNRQLSFMQTEDKGFSPNHVVYIRNMAIFDKPDVFKAVKEKILSMDGVRAVSVANQIPTGPKAPAQLFTINGSEGYLNAVAVDIDYFKTLDIKLAEGRFYNPNFSSDESESILINEAAVKKYSIASPLGKLIKNCNHTYQIVGVIKDFKSDGFETAVLPTAYTLSNRCGPPKTSIIIKISDGRVAGVLKSLRAEWPKINKLDGEDFRYDFMDTLYGQLFKKQEQLKFVFSCLSVVTILIALFGLYAYAKLMIEARFKEIAIRKILGAENFELLSILNSSFLWLVLISNVVAAPLVYIAANRWLQGFAYKQDISLSPFLIAALVTVGLTIETVCIQAFKILKAQPVKALKYE